MPVTHADEHTESEWLPGLLQSLRVQLLVVVGLAAAVLVVLAIREQGLIWSDEIFQVTEPAHRAVFDYGYLAWEYRDGLRSWTLPGLFAGIWAIAGTVGVDSGTGLMLVARLVAVLAALSAIACAMTWAHRARGALASLLAGVMLLVTPVALVMGVHTFAESFAAALLIGAAVPLVGPRPARTWLLAVCGAAAGLAIAIRPQSAVLVLGFLVILVVERRRPELGAYLGGVASVVVFAGLLDWVTWGAPFASTWRYVDFNLIEGGAGKYFGSEPPLFYAVNLATSFGVFGLLVIVGLVGAAWVVPKHLANAVVFVLVHSLTTHKELRFVYPVVPYTVAIAGVGLAWLALRAQKAMVSQKVQAGRSASARRARAKAAGAPIPDSVRHRALAVTGAVLLVFVGFAVVRAATLTFGATGEERFWAPEASVWDNAGDWNRLLSAAGERSSTCGVAIAASADEEGTIFTGAYSFLHRDVPLFTVDARALAADAEVLEVANTVLVHERVPIPEGWDQVASDGSVRMIVRDQPCRPPPPDYTVELPRPGEVSGAP